MTVRFTGGSYQRGIISRRTSGPTAGHITGLTLTADQQVAAVAAGEVRIAIQADLGNQVSAAILSRGAGFKPAVIIDTDGSYQPITLPLDSDGIRRITFGLHTFAIRDVVVGHNVLGGDLGGWVDSRGGLPLGVASPERTSYHSISGRLLGTTVAPASEAFTLALRGITAASMESVGTLLISALNEGEVRFDINAAAGGLTSFTAWADGVIGRPQIRVGGYYEWDLSLRSAVQ